MGTHPIFESDFDCLTDLKTKKMNPQSDSEEDLPLDELVNYQNKQIQQYAQWSEKNAQSALGSNHRAEMEENDGIARNRRKQNQQKYQATLKKLEKEKESIRQKRKTLPTTKLKLKKFTKK